MRVVALSDGKVWLGVLLFFGPGIAAMLTAVAVQSFWWMMVGVMFEIMGTLAFVELRVDARLERMREEIRAGGSR